MRGFYSLWVEPSLEKPNDKYEMQDYDLLTMLLSVLKWQENNGPARMIADAPAREYLEQLGVDTFFQDGLHDLVVPKSIHPKVFWAAGKLFALKSMPAPAVMIDLDLIIWQNLAPFFENCDVGVIHKEEIREEVYPDFSFFNMDASYAFKKKWDKTLLPCNTAMLYINDEKFKDYYCSEAIRFMEYTREEQEKLCHMVFAEQRMLSLCAGEKKVKLDAIFPLIQDIGKQKLFTHTWGHKNILRFNYEERAEFCKRILHRLKKEYPAEYEFIASLPPVWPYLSN